MRPILLTSARAYVLLVCLFSLYSKLTRCQCYLPIAHETEKYLILLSVGRPDPRRQFEDQSECMAAWGTSSILYPCSWQFSLRI